MPSDGSRGLTDRQRAVMERIDRRVPIKVIAQELGVSETRINQHIRALKDIYGADSLNELVETYRTARRANTDGLPESIAADSGKGFSEPAYIKTQLPLEPDSADEGYRVDPGEIVLNDVLPIEGFAPWMRADEPKVVPRVLDGDYAILARLAAIMGIAFGFLAAVVLAVTAGVTISEALDDTATIPVDEQGFS